MADNHADPEAESAAPEQKSGTPNPNRKRKYAVFLAYVGAGYHGMQHNPPFRTIESELEAALHKAGAISDSNAGCFSKIHWSRAGRTDKGVSAIGQVVSAKLTVPDPDTFADSVNQHLPPEIRVFGCQRSTEGFDARKACDKRRYEYLLPAFVFDPREGLNNRQQAQLRNQFAAASQVAGVAAAFAAAVDAAVAAAQAAVVAQQPPVGCAQPPEEQPAAPDEQPAAQPRLPPPSPPPEQQAQQQSGGGAGVGMAESAAGGDGDVDMAEGAAGGGGDADMAEGVAGGDGDVDMAEGAAGGDGGAVTGEGAAGGDGGAGTNAVRKAAGLSRLREGVERSKYMFKEEDQQRLTAVLQQYEGTHNFHNFTVGVPADSKQSRRYITSFSCPGTVSINGRQWVRMVVVGQSFLMHQIRRMVGLAVAVMRRQAPASIINTALDPNRDFHLPLAPELGLFLDDTYYDAHNNRFSKLHGSVSLAPWRAAADRFKETAVYPHIAETDAKELVFAIWIRGVTDAMYRFNSWASRPKVRNLLHQPGTGKRARAIAAAAAAAAAAVAAGPDGPDLLPAAGGGGTEAAGADGHEAAAAQEVAGAASEVAGANGAAGPWTAPAAAGMNGATGPSTVATAAGTNGAAGPSTAATAAGTNGAAGPSTAVAAAGTNAAAGPSTAPAAAGVSQPQRPTCARQEPAVGQPPPKRARYDEQEGATQPGSGFGGRRGGARGGGRWGGGWPHNRPGGKFAAAATGAAVVSASCTAAAAAEAVAALAAGLGEEAADLDALYDML